MEWKSICAEPYRLLFPLGIVAASIGIGLWIPFGLWPNHFPYPGQGHAMIQIQAFLLCFVFGFLGTMLPKVLSIKPLDPVSFSLFPVLILGLIVCALIGAPLLAQILYLATILHFLAFVARRFPSRQANPPPFFLFIAAAMAANILGTLVRIASLAAWIPVAWQKAATILQYQAFILLLIMGVGGFLLPKLFAQGVLDPKVLLAQSGAPLGKLSALVAMLMAGYAVEIAGVVGQFGTSATRIAYALRAGAWIWFLFLELRILKFQGDLPPYLSAARMSLYLIGASLLLPVVWPEKLLAWEHVLFISGFLQLTLSIASRVLAAHAGRLDILTLHKRKVLAYGLLIFMAMFARIFADFRPDAYWAILAVASVFALSALAIWSGIFLPLRSIFPRR